MNFSLYIFGNPKGVYKQMPDDYLASDINTFLKDLRGSRLVIVRKMNLMHYIFMEKIDEKHYFGFCLIFNDVYVGKLKQLTALFRYIIEEYLVKKGDIIRYGKNGGIVYVVDSFSQNAESYKQIYALIKDRFTSQSAQYGISRLTTIFNGRHTISNASIRLEEEDLLRMSMSYNTLIVDDSAGIEYGYLPKVISNLREQINIQKAEIEELERENDKLNKKKKQFRLTLLLSILLVCVSVAFALYANDKSVIINHQSYKLEVLKNTIEIKDSVVNILNSQLKSIYDVYDDIEYRTTYQSWASDNAGKHGSISSRTYSFIAFSGDELYIPSYSVSSEEYDTFDIDLSIDGSKKNLLYVYGEYQDSFSYTFDDSGEYKLTFTYSKDGSYNVGLDKATVQEFYVYHYSLKDRKEYIMNE